MFFTFRGRVCVRVCVRVRMRVYACVRACVCVCVAGGGRLVHLWPGPFFLLSLNTHKPGRVAFLLLPTSPWHCPLSVTATGMGKGRTGWGGSPGWGHLAGPRPLHTTQAVCSVTKQTPPTS